MSSVASRDPLVRAAAALQATEGLASKPCEACFRAGRDFKPPDVYVARRVGGPNDGECFVVYECVVCGHGASYPIPAHLLLAADLRVDPRSGEAAAENRPRAFYGRGEDDSELAFYVDPADGQPPVLVGRGPAGNANVRRVAAALDFLAGGSARE